MKRLIVLLLVLSLTSTASAVVGMEVYVNNIFAGDFAPVAVGDTIKVVITDTAPTLPVVGSVGFADFKINVTQGSYDAGSEVWADGPYSGAPFFIGPWRTDLPPGATMIVVGGGFDV